MDVFLIRHADPDYEQDSLTGLGVRQAERLARYLRDVPLTAVYCSPLGRAVETMARVLRGRSVRPVFLGWLKELDGEMGIGHAAWTVTAAELEAEPSLGERIRDFMAGQLSDLLHGWDALMAEHGYDRTGRTYRRRGGAPASAVIAAFAHAGMIQTLLAGLFDWPLAGFYASLTYLPTGITHLRMVDFADRAELRVVSLAARPHLEARETLGL